MFTNLDAQYLADIAAAYVEAELNGTGLPRVDNAMAARLQRIAENLQRLDEADAYDRGFIAGQAYQPSRSNVLSSPDEEPTKRQQSKELAKVTKGWKPKPPNGVTLDLKELGL